MHQIKLNSEGKTKKMFITSSVYNFKSRHVKLKEIICEVCSSELWIKIRIVPPSKLRFIWVDSIYMQSLQITRLFLYHVMEEKKA